MTAPVPSILWSVAGTDSGGGAGLSADLRAADAFGAHLCPVVAAVTAQHSRAVTRIEAVATEVLEAQMAALADDLPPRVIKTGLLGSVGNVLAVARQVDRLRAHGPVALVVDPVLAASTGARFGDASLLQAIRDELLPRATLVTPNRREAAALLGTPPPSASKPEAIDTIPEAASRLRALGAEAVCITGGDSIDARGHALDWIDSAQARGWLALPRIATPHNHGTGCTFASSAAAALSIGFVSADAVILSKMATAHALRCGYVAGSGAGPVRARPGFAANPSLLPVMSWGTEPAFLATAAAPTRKLGLYAIVESAERVRQVLSAGVRTVQLRIKAPMNPDAGWHARLRDAVGASILACEAADAELFVNDHWELARALGAGGVHLGQEDLLALGEQGRRSIQASGLALGISSHSLWELCRTRSLAPRYVACGPVWPTLTKSMPWRAQGLDNLAWWRRMAGAPVVAIGGILEPGQVRDVAACGVDGVCVVRALGADPSATVPVLREALAQAAIVAERRESPTAPEPLPVGVKEACDGPALASEAGFPELPHPTL